MKTTNYKTRLSGILILLALLGCETNEVSSSKLLVKELSDPLCYKYEFEYQGSLLTSFRELFGQRVAMVTDFQYRGDELIRVDVNTDYGMTIVTELEYGVSGLIEKETMAYVWDQSELKTKYTTTTIFEYDENKILRSKLMTYDDPNFLPLRTRFEWSQDNITKITYEHLDKTGKPIHTSHKYFIYDKGRNHTNQNIAFKYITGAGTETILSKNNVIAIKNDWTENPAELVEELTVKFTYNQQGYPEKYISTSSGQNYKPEILLEYY